MKGFTLIELLVVISIIALLAGVGVANFRDFGRRQEVNNFARTLITDLRLAQTGATDGRKGLSCNGAFLGYRVDFSIYDHTPSSKANGYTINILCSTGGSTNTTFVKTVNLTNDLFILFNRNTASVTLLFKPLALGTDLSPANDLTLTVSNNSIQQTQIVTVTSTGQIK